jgi:hypothetical protein
MPNVKCIAWNFDECNFMNFYNDKNLKRLRFENGDFIPNVENYFTEE